ncbi:NAD(P)-binding protein [Xylariaceae sp. FL0255]|nr:NAD(P)-binding protein [Xylariaceae sp. FL0255]
MPFDPGTLPDLKGRVFIVTGGNSGIGYHTVAHLAKHGAHVYMCVRSPEKGKAAIAEIKNADASAEVDLLPMDHADLASVVAAAKHFLTLETALHGLVNNAGIMAPPFEMTKDGHEVQWQTNYLSHWVFTHHLLPLMLETSRRAPLGSVRLVNLTSEGHKLAPKDGINFRDLSLSESGPWTRYGQSKLANILHANAMHDAYGPVSARSKSGEGQIWVSSVHPGVVATNLGRSFGFFLGCFSSILCRIGVYWSPEKGSFGSLFCVASQDMTATQSGGYFEVLQGSRKGSGKSDNARNVELTKKLEEWTLELMRKEGWVER